MIQTILIFVFSILFTVSAQLLFKKGVLELGTLSFSINSIFNLILQVLRNLWLMGGVFLLGISFIFWLFLLSRFKLSIAYPILTSVDFILIMLFAFIFLKEKLLPLQILGIFVIIIGIFLLLKP